MALTPILAMPKARAPAIGLHLRVFDVFAALKNKIIDISLLRGILPLLLSLGDCNGYVFLQFIEFFEGCSVDEIDGEAPRLAVMAEVVPIGVGESFAAVIGPGRCVLRGWREDIRGEVDSIELKGFKHINHNKPVPR